VSKLNRPTYSKDMRDNAKRDRMYLITFDVITPSGNREVCYQGPMSKPNAKLIADAWLEAIQREHVAPGEAGGGK
jgi:hypothetical protein